MFLEMALPKMSQHFNPLASSAFNYDICSSHSLVLCLMLFGPNHACFPYSFPMLEAELSSQAMVFGMI
jgi:hypothetical protein